MRIVAALLWSALLWSGPAVAQEQPPPADPLTAKVDVSDVERFVALWKKTNGHPTAAQIDAEYIQGGGEGVRGFIATRKISGDNIAKAIAEHHDWYEQALDRCLPWVADSTADLRTIYLSLRGLLPEKPLPQIYMVIANGNTGGTTVPGAQLLGLEVVCHISPTSEKFREEMRTFFAHETAHTFQHDPDRLSGKGADPLLFDILVEGGADYVASLVTGASPNAAREAYGRAHEAEMWSQFLKDRPIANRNHHDGANNSEDYSGEGKRAFFHWLYNGGRNPARLPGWETDMGYWLGMQIAKAYVEKAVDPHAAIREVLALEDPAEILRKSGYVDKFKR